MYLVGVWFENTNVKYIKYLYQEQQQQINFSRATIMSPFGLISAKLVFNPQLPVRNYTKYTRPIFLIL